MPEVAAPWSLLHLLGDAAAATNNTNDDVNVLSPPLQTPFQVTVTELTTPPRIDSPSGSPVENSSSTTSHPSAVLPGSNPAQPTSLPVREPSPPPSPPLLENNNTPSFPTRLFNMQLPKKPQKEETRLEDGYQVQRFDVICLCRGRKDMLYHHHVGNNRFRLLVEMRVDRYKAAEMKDDKTTIIREIIDAVQSGGGRFLRREATDNKQQNQHDNDADHDDNEEGNIYYDIGYRKTLDKVGKAIRTVVRKQEKNGASKREPPANAPTTTRTIQEVIHVPPPPPPFCNNTGSPNVNQYHGTKRVHEDNYPNSGNNLLTANSASRDSSGANMLWRSSLRRQPRYPAGSIAALSRMQASHGSHEPLFLYNRRAALQLYLAEQRLFREAAQINHRFHIQALSRKGFEQARGEDLRHEVAAHSAKMGNMPPSFMPLIVPKELPPIAAAKNLAIPNQDNKKQKVADKRTYGPYHSHRQETADRIITPTKSEQNDWQAKLEVTPTPPQTLSLDVPNLDDQLDDDDVSDSSSFYPQESELSTSHVRTQLTTDEEEEEEDVDWRAHTATSLMVKEFRSSYPDKGQEEPEDDESDASSFYPHESELKSTQVRDARFTCGADDCDDYSQDSAACYGVTN